jgi:hypothetical protein
MKKIVEPMPDISGQSALFFDNNTGNRAALSTASEAAPSCVEQQNNATAASGVAFSSASPSAKKAPVVLSLLSDWMH